MKKFFRLLLLLLLATNLLLLFVFDDLIPKQIHLPALEEPQAPLSEEETGNVQAADEGEEAPGTEEPVESGEPQEMLSETAVPQPEEEPAPQEEEEQLPVCRIISPGGSNIRAGAGTGFEVIGSYPYDTLLQVLGEAENGWYPIRHEDGTEGYIFETQIEIFPEAEPDGLTAE